jgi:hypothetical protein
MRFLKTLFIFGLVAISFLCEAQSKNANREISCDDSLWNFVYNKYRLKVVEKCLTVTGIIQKIKYDNDGDGHFLLLPDSAQNYLINKKNIEKKKGCLVIEPICLNKITKESALGTCDGYVNHVQLPKVGDYVKVTGSYVKDRNNGWMEIHPVTKIEVLKN